MKLTVKRGEEVMLVCPINFGSGGFFSGGDTINLYFENDKKNNRNLLRIESDNSRRHNLLYMEVGKEPVTLEIK